MSRRRGEAGFTLLEILVAIVVLGLLLAGLAGATRFGIRASGMQARMIGRRADLDATDRTLRALIGGLAPGYRIDPPDIAGRPHAFGFAGTLPEGAAVGAGLPPGAGREASMLLFVDAAHQLVLRWTPAVHARRLGPAPAPHEAVLLEGVARVDFAYWREGAGWLGAWDGRTPPALVRIGLVLVGRGRGEGWPAIVIAPRRLPADE